MSLQINKVSYFDLYTIHLDRLPDHFQENFNVEGLQSIETQKQTFEKNLQILKQGFENLGPNFEMCEGFRILQDKIRYHTEAIRDIDRRIDNGTETKYDAGKVQSLVNEILNIQESECEESEKSKVLQSLIDSEALHLNPKLFEDIKNKKFQYNPAPYLRNFLDEHPEIKTVLLGCGRQNDGNASCMRRFGDSHKVPGLRIALDALNCPDVIIDMHNPDLWIAFKDNSLEFVGDHTRANQILFDDKERSKTKKTLEMIFRKLKPGGFLQLGSSAIHEWYFLMLESCGFTVQNERAVKPS